MTEAKDKLIVYLLLGYLKITKYGYLNIKLASVFKS